MLTAQSIKETGRLINRTVKESINSPMELSMKENGKINRWMVLDTSLIVLVGSGEGNSEKVNLKVKTKQNW